MISVHENIIRMFGPNNRVGSKCCNNYLRKAILIVVVIPFFNHFWLSEISSHGNARNLLRIFLGYISLDYLSQADAGQWSDSVCHEISGVYFANETILNIDQLLSYQEISDATINKFHWWNVFFKCFAETLFQMSGIIKTLSDSISQWKSDTSQINCYCN